MDVYTACNKATLQALQDVKHTMNIRRLYTPYARGLRKTAMVVPAMEFMKMSTAALRYSEFLTINALVGVFKWLEWLHKVTKHTPTWKLRKMSNIQQISEKYVSADTANWTVPTFYIRDGDRIICKDVTIMEYCKIHNTDGLTFFQHLMHIILFGFPVLPSFIAKLRLTKPLELYVRSRLFQGKFDWNYPSKFRNANGFTSNFLGREQFNGSLEDLSNATSYVELENMLMQCTFIGADSVPMFALARKERFNILSHTPIGEYMEYVRRCENNRMTPVGFKTYKKVFHPIESEGNQLAICDFSF